MTNQQIPSPCFVVEEQSLLNNLKVLDMVQKASGAKIILALKGFAMYKTFPLVKPFLAGATASSLNEAKLASQEFGKEVHVYCPAYIPNEMDELIRMGNHITFNSLSQWELYKDKVKEVGIEAALRINPEYSEVTTDLYNPAVKGSRLGVRSELIGDTLPEGISGLHFHTLCENDAEVLERTLEAVEERFGHLLHQAKWVNFGGGHAITRKGYNIELLIQLIQNIKTNYNVDVILEPGSAVGWETGFLKSTVLDVVDSEGVKTLMIDSSFAAHMPDCLEMPYKPRVRGENPDGEFEYNIGGMTCLAGDFIGGFKFDKEIKAGDTIIFEDMIHYTMVKTTTFNGVNLPSIGMLKTDGSFELFKSYGYEEFISRI
ncbi:carboxynorspermidine decarboxylase [Sediminitomix flava]|uniref:Carboxynorspermidine/carboxyspermidine decarboxylase n=1 Tax=Sediminitomix flava TaxID=379075 RepID=A0A315ZB00_SEDFL|nr:carboxynorspermidine decarboxylase [Sediminitomix flava]PWJ42766.1 carboxynorspermidine decarboxylase [Sediminitomix flava]